MFHDSFKPTIDSLEAKQGYVMIPSERELLRVVPVGDICVFLRDPTTGKYFDSLTNEDVLFAPSELYKVLAVTDKKVFWYWY